MNDALFRFMGGPNSRRGQETLPPWMAFPHLVAWAFEYRMGSAEEYRCNWHEYVENLPDFESRVAYFRRYDPAPYPWFLNIWVLLHPEDRRPNYYQFGVAEERRRKLADLGLIAHDAGYRIWRGAQPEFFWPWQRYGSPSSAARYFIRDLWFWSRWASELRETAPLDPPEAPEPWEACTRAIRTGTLENLNLDDGLFTLATACCAGHVPATWELGLESHVPGAGPAKWDYAQVFDRWFHFVMDDVEQIGNYYRRAGLPPNWMSRFSGEELLAWMRQNWPEALDEWPPGTA